MYTYISSKERGLEDDLVEVQTSTLQSMSAPPVFPNLLTYIGSTHPHCIENMEGGLGTKWHGIPGMSTNSTDF